MRRRLISVVVGFALVSTLLACSNAGGSRPSASDRATSLAQTAAALLTSTAAASITPITPIPPTLAPSATVAPTATLTPVPATSVPTPTITSTPCANDSDFVSDVTIYDGKPEKAGTAFSKTWRLRNSGQCPWTTAYTLRNVGGEVMGGTTISLPNTVPVSATIDLSVAFVAPKEPGKHLSYWQLFTPDGVAFGTKPYVQIMVP